MSPSRHLRFTGAFLICYFALASNYLPAEEYWDEPIASLYFNSGLDISLVIPGRTVFHARYGQYMQPPMQLRLGVKIALY
jgi:hypothetical protein